MVPADDLIAEAEKLAAQLATTATLANGMVKKLLMVSFDNGLETQLDLEANGIASMVMTGDGQEGVSAFTEKRKPEFQGR